MSFRPLSSSEVDIPWVPEGFVAILGPDNQHYVVPEFMVPALHQILDVNEEKKKIPIGKAAGTVSTFPIFVLGRKFYRPTEFRLAEIFARNFLGFG